MIKTISEVHRSEIKIDPNIDLVDTGSKNGIKVAPMLPLQPQKVATTPQQRHFDTLLDKNQIVMITNQNTKLALNITERNSSINNFNRSLVKWIPSQISYLDFYFYRSGTHATSKMGLSVTTVVNNHPSATFTKSTILDSCSSLAVRSNNKMKTLTDHYPQTITSVAEGLLQHLRWSSPHQYQTASGRQPLSQ